MAIYFKALIILVFACNLSTFEASCPDIIPRKEWRARGVLNDRPFKVRPPSYVIIHHSHTEPCTSVQKCIESVKQIQNDHMDNVKLNDIGYNFIIGGDGNIYEGRGWDTRGAHVIEYNNRSMGISVIGTFDNFPPSPVQLSALKNLIACGAATNKLASDYHLVAHRQVNQKRTCPGNAFFELIKKMPHWDSLK